MSTLLVGEEEDTDATIDSNIVDISDNVDLNSISMDKSIFQSSKVDFEQIIHDSHDGLSNDTVEREIVDISEIVDINSIDNVYKNKDSSFGFHFTKGGIKKI